jgi:hypothetical protein
MLGVWPRNCRSTPARSFSTSRIPAAALVEPADACYRGLAEFAVVSVQNAHLPDRSGRGTGREPDADWRPGSQAHGTTVARFQCLRAAGEKSRCQHRYAGRLDCLRQRSHSAHSDAKGSGELFQNSLRLSEVGGIETLGEPAVDGRQKIARFGPPALFAPQTGRRWSRRAAPTISLAADWRSLARGGSVVTGMGIERRRWAAYHEPWLRFRIAVIAFPPR